MAAGTDTELRARRDYHRRRHMVHVEWAVAELQLKGLGYAPIARKLNERGLQTPREWAREQKEGRWDGKPPQWSPTMVKRVAETPRARLLLALEMARRAELPGQLQPQGPRATAQRETAVKQIFELLEHAPEITLTPPTPGSTCPCCGSTVAANPNTPDVAGKDVDN
jgi:hypothetical protein